MHKLKHVLEEMAGEKAPGPTPTFSIFHLLYALELIAEKPIGRNKLAKELKVGEGVVRTIINRLKDASLIKTSRAGCVLTSKGLKIWREYKSIFKKMVKLEKNELTFAECNYAILVKNRGHKVKSGMEQRDAAIIMGAKSATTILFKTGCLRLPSVNEDLAKNFPNATKQITKLLKPEENDVIIIVSANSWEKAVYGSLAAAWTLIDNSN
ncbi:DUF4443 domain-containing protein [Candidatus Bathyarchaeota archaeon]|nr:DUF4443 domain-containing protein [Candidatus Bathyarchaeota archaeon]